MSVIVVFLRPLGLRLVSVEVKVIAPVAMERGQRFAIREGGRTIGAGRVTEVIE